jgi:hypothetical protein
MGWAFGPPEPPPRRAPKNRIAYRSFLDDYKNMGGRVTVSSDAGYIYNTFGFSTIEEMELLQEAGFHPLEVIRGSTPHGAQALHEPKGKPIDFGVVRAGLLADLVIVPENPIANLKVLYGTGAVRLNDNAGKAERVGGHQVHDQGRHHLRRQAPARGRAHDGRGRKAQARHHPARAALRHRSIGVRRELRADGARDEDELVVGRELVQPVECAAVDQRDVVAG